VHLALSLRISELLQTDMGKLGPNAKAKLQRHVDLCREPDETAQKARGNSW